MLVAIRVKVTTEIRATVASRIQPIEKLATAAEQQASTGDHGDPPITSELTKDSPEKIREAAPMRQRAAKKTVVGMRRITIGRLRTPPH